MAILNIDKLRAQRRPIPQLQLRDRAQTWWKQAHTPIHMWGGFACIDIAAFTTIPQLGWAATGISLFVLDALRSDAP